MCLAHVMYIHMHDPICSGTRCHRIRAPGKISSPGGSGLRILPPPGPGVSTFVYEARKKAPPLGNFLRGSCNQGFFCVCAQYHY